MAACSADGKMLLFCAPPYEERYSLPTAWRWSARRRSRRVASRRMWCRCRRVCNMSGPSNGMPRCGCARPGATARAACAAEACACAALMPSRRTAAGSTAATARPCWWRLRASEVRIEALRQRGGACACCCSQRRGRCRGCEAGGGARRGQRLRRACVGRQVGAGWSGAVGGGARAAPGRRNACFACPGAGRGVDAHRPERVAVCAEDPDRPRNGSRSGRRQRVSWNEAPGASRGP